MKPIQQLNQTLQLNNCSLGIRINKHNYQLYNRVWCQKHELIKENLQTLEFENSQWEITTKTTESDDSSINLDITFVLKSGVCNQSSVSVDFEFSDWSTENYVLLPAAAYNGNRFESRRIAYSPKLLDPKDIGIDKPTIVSDIPRLEIGAGYSRIQDRSGSMSIPSVGFHAAKKNKGFWLLTPQKNEKGDLGYDVEETRNRDKCTISLNAPIMRELYKYRITDNRFPTDDIPVDFKEGDTVTFQIKLYFFDCENVQTLYDKFVSVRKSLYGEPKMPHFLPYSACFEVQEEKFNTQNFVPEYGYYSVGMREMFLQDWQIGWTGGMISTYPLLFAGGEQSKTNVVRNFDWLFPNGISPSGFFYDSGEHGNKWYGGDIRKPHTKNWHLVRKSGDGLYYIIKQFLLMGSKNIEIKEAWKSGTKQVADTFVKVWKKYGQLGNFVDSITAEIQVGGSTSGAIVPAALLLASKYYNHEEYKQTAIEIGEYYYKNFVQKGITNGGPGDAMQNPDSESSYAMLESFALLYQFTKDINWKQRTVEMAHQFATWVLAYNYEFPSESTLGKLDIHSAGIVCANTQNKHGAPGICTHSGVALLRLYRFTQNIEYLKLLKEIAHALPQFLSTPYRPIEGMKLGWMSERASTTDWLEGIGQLMYGSTWAETSLMLTYIEIPGIYIVTDQDFVFAFDHIDTKIISKTQENLEIEISNPTIAPAKIKIFVEKSNKELILAENYLFDAPIVEIKANSTTIINVNKNTLTIKN